MKPDKKISLVKKITGSFLTLILIVHFLIVTVYLLNDSPLKAKHKRFVENYISPFFLQNWQLFSPPAKSDKVLLFRYLKFSKGRIDTVTRNATSSLITKYKNETSSSDRVSYFLYRNIIGMCELNNALLDSLQKNERLKNDSVTCMKIFNRGIERSLFFGNLYDYSKKCFFKLTPRAEIKSLDSVSVIISIIDREFPGFDQRSVDFENEKNFKSTVWNSRPKKLKNY